MHIAIDARMYGTAQRGIGRYLVKLIEALEEITPSPQPSPTDGEGEILYTIFLRRANFNEYTPSNPNFKKALWDAPWYGWREQMQNAELRMQNFALVHFPHWNVPLFFNRPFVVTIHDLELFSSNRTRENSTRGHLVYWFKFQMFKIIFRHAVTASCAIIVPSNAVREQLLDRYPQVRKKVHVIYEAPTITSSRHSERRSEESHTLPMARGEIATLSASGRIARNDIDEHYILYVGAAYPHKNLPRLLEAWQIVHETLQEYKLVLVGREDFFWKKLKQQFVISTKRPDGARGEISSTTIKHSVRSLDSARDDENCRVIFYGPATDDELATLYRNASLLVQPSLEEGFSLSPLEALSFGTPVAVSDIPVHREILNSAAIFFNPHESASLADAIKTILTDPSSKQRAGAEGKALLSRFSWAQNAHKTLALYATAKKV